MPTDIAIDPNTGDLVIAARNDFSLRTGQEVLEQRIRTRLRARLGAWHLDPTLGSNLRELARVPSWQAQTDAPRMVREALAGMDDIHLREVTANIDPDDQRRIIINMSYSPVEPSGEASATEVTMTTNFSIAG